MNFQLIEEGQEPKDESQQAALDALEAGAAAEGALVPAAAGEAPTPADRSADQQKQLAGILEVVGAVLSKGFPTLATVYTKDRCASVAKDLNPIFEELGWTISGAGAGKWLVGLFAVGGLALDTTAAIKHDVAVAKEKARQAQAAAAQPAGDQPQPGADHANG